MSKHIVNKVRNNRLDVGLVGAPQEDEKVISSKVLIDELAVIIPHGHKWSNRKNLRPEELTDQPFILSAVEALDWTDKVMGRLGLKLNEDKTSIRDGLRGNFDFLGYTFGYMVFKKDGSWYTGASPSKERVSRLRIKVRKLLRPCEKGAWPDVRDRLNALLRGWCTYFCYGTTMIAYRGLNVTSTTE